MKFDTYERKSLATAYYPEIQVKNPKTGEWIEANWIYPATGLGEAGEVLELIKKGIRDDYGVMTQERATKILDECGDVLWYITNLLAEVRKATGRLDISLHECAKFNVVKLAERARKREAKSG